MFMCGVVTTCAPDINLGSAFSRTSLYFLAELLLLYKASLLASRACIEGVLFIAWLNVGLCSTEQSMSVMALQFSTTVLVLMFSKILNVNFRSPEDNCSLIYSSTHAATLSNHLCK